MSAVTTFGGQDRSRVTALADTVDVTTRNLLNLRRTPQALVFATIQPVLFVLLFRYAFGGAISVPGVRYVDYLMPGVFVQAVTFGAMGTAVGLSYDLRSGLVQRFRTLPMSHLAILAGRTNADLVRNLFVVVVMSIVGFAVGFTVHTSVLGFVAGLTLIALFTYALSWFFVIVGLRIADPESAQAAGVPIMFTLVFASSAFVPIHSMPGWLQAFANHQPVTATVNATRALMIGGPTVDHVLTALAWSLGGLVLFATLATREYRRMRR
jgi:ABC-2 type transport system permease protein/oleandomycin transport system permease protein